MEMASLGASLPVSRLRDKFRNWLTGTMTNRRQSATADKNVNAVRARFMVRNEKN